MKEHSLKDLSVFGTDLVKKTKVGLDFFTRIGRTMLQNTSFLLKIAVSEGYTLKNPVPRYQGGTSLVKILTKDLYQTRTPLVPRHILFKS